MKYLNLVTSFYMQHPIVNTVIIVGVFVLAWFIWTYRKLEAIALVSSVKAELISALKGKEKLEYALSWLKKQKFYKESILRFVPDKIFRGIINIVFRKNKTEIESK